MPKKISIFELQEWDNLVKKTYGKPYSFQQQDGCKDRGLFKFTVPSNDANDFENDTLPEVVNHDEIGVSFKAWLERDPNQALDGNGEEREKSDESWAINLWWARNFYPDFQTVANDLCSKGKIKPGNYAINIDW